MHSLTVPRPLLGRLILRLAVPGRTPGTDTPPGAASRPDAPGVEVRPSVATIVAPGMIPR